MSCYRARGVVELNFCTWPIKVMCIAQPATLMARVARPITANMTTVIAIVKRKPSNSGTSEGARCMSSCQDLLFSDECAECTGLGVHDQSCPVVTGGPRRVRYADHDTVMRHFKVIYERYKSTAKYLADH